MREIKAYQRMDEVGYSCKDYQRMAGLILFWGQSFIDYKRRGRTQHCICVKFYCASCIATKLYKQKPGGVVVDGRLMIFLVSNKILRGTDLEKIRC